MEIEEILTLQVPFLKEPALKADLVREAKLVTVEAGTPILKDGQYVKTVPLLVNGLVKVVKQEGEKEILLYYIYPLESCIVSIHCGINDLKSKVKAIAEEASTALLLPAHQVGQWQQQYLSFNQFVLNLYQKRFEDVLDAFNALAFQSLDDRMITYLEAKARALGHNKLKMTHQDLADELGSARETVSR
ncbi:MAG: Crp/Fnr family transcriptional regulator, partial [Bacteroidota bacterium]